MALLPAVSSCHSPARLEGEKLKNLLCCFKSEPSRFKYWDYSLFVYLAVSLHLFVWIWLLWLEQEKKKKKKNPRRLNGCLLASMFVCLQIVNNKLSLPPSLSMIGPWGMWPHLWEKIIRTAVQSALRKPLCLLPEATLHKDGPLFLMLSPPWYLRLGSC